MKARKLSGVRLINYLNDGINWVDHKDIVLDFWIKYKCKDYGYHPKMFEKMYYVLDLPIKVQKIYEEWFKSYDFNNVDDKYWIDFVSKTLNIFYHTSDPTLLSDNTWFVVLMKSEEKARKICNTQILHGNPNINTFWKLDTNSKSEEIAGRRNGYVYSNILENVSNKDTRDFYWAITYQCPESVKLFYVDGDERKSRCINWAANAKNITLLKITESGRFMVIPVEVKGKVWRPTKLIPNSLDIKNKVFSGLSLKNYLENNYYELYGKIEEVENYIKIEKKFINQRKNVVGVLNDEEVDIGKIVDVEDFIVNGNVDIEKRIKNQEIRKKIIEKNRLREKIINKKLRQMKKNKSKKDIRDMNKLNPLLSKK